MNWVYVFLGGGLGSLVRYGFSLLFQMTSSPFPWATLTANALAALVIGILCTEGMRPVSSTFWLFAGVGFCGGLSTFSTFSLETVQLFRQGEIRWAWCNIVLSVTCSILLVVFALSRFKVE